MKYLVILGDGMADLKVEALGGKTPLQYANIPNIDRLAQGGIMGLAKTVPDGLPPGSDVANLGVMGYDPDVYYTGRAPLEAVSMGVKLNDRDIAFRCNLVTVSNEPEYKNKTMVDYSAGEIKSEHAAVLINELSEFLNEDNMKFYPGISYRHLMVWDGGPDDTDLTPPHDISGRNIRDYLPKGNGGERILSIMEKSNEFLSNHRINKSNNSTNPGNSVWFWGQGKTPSIDKFSDRFGVTGAMISAVDLLKGIAISAEMKVIEVEGATGTFHTNYRGKAEAALDAFKSGIDMVYLHVEAPDEAGHQGKTDEKVKAIENIDQLIVGPILEQMKQFGDFKIMVLPDHPTPLSLMTHTSEPVPFVIYDSRNVLDNKDATYCEDNGAKGIFIQDGYKLMEKFIKE
ncbi:MAG: cofactor-independent phosphoglycerate mutase [Peptococcaceae bacterium]|nr:cofactor-independent phosphoglycerate mutase [Peptococcaceae bacterium]